MADTKKREFKIELASGIQEDKVAPLEITATKVIREFKQDPQPAPASQPLHYPIKSRSINIESARPASKDELILLEIAKLSREWDYLDYCELVTSLHVEFIKGNTLKATEIQLKLLQHPLHRKDCFNKNVAEYNMLSKILEEKSTL
jgi:hypothetical protein